ncbi:Redox-sensing transcriptional regulator QorR [Klebsiella pneumoniae]|uniref:winged helix-turn-helix transcriptional regulator n=1 Tax=Klebsiella pneumoniae TaxID=573 RepID=UPI000E2C28D2|nr:helix-turn-helix domain-containing protein [Klebsiella pneumoniae]SWI96413.1 Redox-sensing transcriptional regulator QorR [Klebsiella pneumoniae]
MSLSHKNLPEELPAPDSGGCQATREILDRIGDKWSLYIIASLANGKRRFNELRRNIEGISQRMLTPRVEYELTELGRTLLDPVMALVNWANDNRLAIAEAHQRFDDAHKPDAL